PLFPLMRDELKPKFTAAGDGARSGRAQVVSSQGDDLWVLAQGGMQKFCFTLDPKSGPRVVEDRQWKQPLPLGSPLHRSQVDATGATLFLVTQSLTRNACLATAVEADTGKIRWQRQFGLVCQGEPVVLGPSSGGEVLAMAQGGGVFGFQPASHPNRADQQWQIGGRPLSKSLEELSAALPATLQPGGDGETAYAVSFPGNGNTLLMRRFWVEGGKTVSLDKDAVRVQTPTPPQGTPAVGSDSVLVPLRDGSLFRARLPGGQGGS